MLNPSLKSKENHHPISGSLPKIFVAKKQKTIKTSINFSGVGLHTGNKVTMSINPAPSDTGYVFRTFKKGRKISIRAHYKNVTSTNLCTMISDSNGNSVSTVEHVLSALSGLDIDNAFIDLDSNEVPVCDGSSKQFVDSINTVGFESQSSFKKFIKILKNVEVKEGNKVARVSPFDQTLISCKIDYDHKCIGKQSISLLLNSKIYQSQICSSRTFGFLEDVERLRSKGLALGGSLKNAIVLGKDKIINDEGLRFSDEFVRHKVLDFIGDISLSGYKMLGSFLTSSSGHSLNVKLLEKIFESPSNWELVCSN